jgi:magnesium-transporting ATPase (P-type)
MNLMILVLMCSVVGILGAMYQNCFNFLDKQKDSSFYVDPNTGDPISGRNYVRLTISKTEFTGFVNPLLMALTILANCMIIFQNIIPIAIYISVDFAKAVQVSSILH